MSTEKVSLALPSVRHLNGLWRLFTVNRKVTIGLAVLLFFVVLAALGPLFIHTDPNAPGTDLLAEPSASHWLGTTQIGQDVLAQVVIGAQLSLIMGLVTGTITTLISTVVGMISGYFGGWIDEIFSLFSNVFLVLPTLPLAILLAAFLPRSGSFSIGFVIVITGWSWGARVLRAQTLSMRHREFVDAARANGEGWFRIIFFEIFPNESAIVAAELLGTVIYAILAEAGLEFLGLGNINTVSWGTMFYWAANNDALLLGAWWWIVPPGLCIALLGAGLAFINFGIDEIANPRLRAEPKLEPARRAQIVEEVVETPPADETRDVVVQE
ncbi:MAG TPA: ABC transporter permease [Ktedonobacteraceae bacterium]|nr:ABC transporter permease [Ktedonobacteraceae bacterium]